MSLKEENTLIVKNILDKTFFAAWKNPSDPLYCNSRSLELIINGKCDLCCRYCYITKFGNQLYPDEIHNDNIIIKNIKMLLTWLKENDYKPKMEIFSGETLMQNVGYDVLDMVVDFCSSYKGDIVIPTNMNFIMHDNLLNKYLAIYDKAKKLGVRIGLSASIDGLYCDKNRPFKNDLKKRDYDKIFQFAKNYNISFHPMIYSEEIEYWGDNFLWFQEMFKKYEIPWTALYLLEVRNSEWSVEQIKEYEKFLRFVVTWIRNNMSSMNNREFLTYVLRNQTLNVFNILSSVGRGLGCSIQSAIQLRTADLTVFPCHRLTYDYFKMYKFVHDENKIIGIEGINPELTITQQTMNHKIFPYCQNCLIKYVCNGQCLGSMYENTGDIFTPVPNVCLLEHAKVKTIINILYELNIFPENLEILDINKKTSIRLIKEITDRTQFR